jgi:hypothetical protein
MRSKSQIILPLQVMLKRPDLKIVVMSATLDALKFQEYFDNAPLMKVTSSFYTSSCTPCYLLSVLECLTYLHKKRTIHFYLLSSFSLLNIPLILIGTRENTSCRNILHSRARERLRRSVRTYGHADPPVRSQGKKETHYLLIAILIPLQDSKDNMRISS